MTGLADQLLPGQTKDRAGVGEGDVCPYLLEEAGDTGNKCFGQESRWQGRNGTTRAPKQVPTRPPGAVQSADTTTG